MNKLLPSGSCDIHSIHGAIRTGEDGTYWDIKKLLKALH